MHFPPISRRALLALFPAIAFCPTAAKAAQAIHLTTGMIDPWTNAEGAGFHQVLVRELFSRLHIAGDVELNTASSRAFALANEGVTDGLAGRVAGIEAEYPNLIRVPERMFMNDFVACTATAEPIPPGWTGLVPKAVAYILGWQVFEHNLPPVRELTQVKDTAQLLTLLKAGRTEVILHERWQILHQARLMGIQIHVQEPPLARVPMYLYLHRRHADLIEPAAAALKAMKADGSYEAIAQRVFLGLGSSVTGLK